jgi:hypothetical protein
LPGAFQNFLDFLFMPIGHGRNHGLFVLEIAIDQTDADPGFGADVVHARLVETTLGKARHGGVENLSRPIKDGVGLRVGHWAKTMNERSFIVKWPGFYEAIRSAAGRALAAPIVSNGRAFGCSANCQIEIKQLNPTRA